MPNFVFVIAVFSFTLASVNAMMTGGVMDQDPKDPEWMVLKAQTQVVAGTRFIFEILFGESECKKGLYKIELWEKPWQNFEQFNVEKIRDVAAGEQL
ncbi:hypothetical protein ANCDUO_22524 [Ancylostoma duodenale]|uniref:Cystatin domain-containing protein n=1 Tax=Ancylostoma duodenale TaxID=51022 RepID=A0A0C2FR91_9BILA|nr:hypothetical protein ANCDUO_22524 [Ancylostoma duodenale]